MPKETSNITEIITATKATIIEAKAQIINELSSSLPSVEEVKKALEIVQQHEDFHTNCKTAFKALEV